MDAEAIKEIRRRAEAATPGPWQEFAESGEWWMAQMAPEGECGETIIADTGADMFYRQEDVDYIAAANPAA